MLIFTAFSERAYARGSTATHLPVPVEAMGQIYADFGHRFRAEQEVHDLRREDLLELGIGTYFPCRPEIVEAAVEALRMGNTRYLNLPALKEAIAAKYMDEQCVSLDPASNIALLGSARSGMALSMLAGIEPGDRVIVPDPDYIGITHAASAIGAEITRVPMSRQDNGSFRPDLDAIEDAARAGLKAAFLTNPNNPTGAVWSRDELSALSLISNRHGAFVMVNEIYDKLVHRGIFTSYCSVGDPEESIVVGGTSKSYEMTGFGLGWLVSSRTNVARMEDLAFLTHQSKPDAPSQFAALAALTSPIREDAPRESCKRLFQNAQATAKALEDIEGCLCPLPEAGQFAFPFVGGDDLDLARFLLEKVGLQVVPGSVWGLAGTGHLRIALANPASLQREGLERLRRGIQSYRERH